MLRIAKTTPGVLDLAPIRDERGIAVSLNGPSHRDVPDHELHNPVLQRVIDAKWVTVTKVPIEEPESADPVDAPGEPAAAASEPPVVDTPIDDQATAGLAPEPPTDAASTAGRGRRRGQAGSQ